MDQPSQLIFPRLDLQILTSQVDAETGYVQGTICKDDLSWTKGSQTCKDYSIETNECSDVGDQGISASEACKVACNTCPKDVKIQRDIGRTYNRLPSPVEDTLEPSYSSILQDDKWHMGDISDASRNPELYDKLDELEEKVDNVRKSMVSMKCLCSDIKDDGIKPYRCGEVSDKMVWGDVLTWTDVDSKDTDVRYPVTCQNGADYSDATLNPSLENLELVYNCTSQDWETRERGNRKNPFSTFDFKSTVVKCDHASPTGVMDARGVLESNGYPVDKDFVPCDPIRSKASASQKCEIKHKNIDLICDWMGDDAALLTCLPGPDKFPFTYIMIDGQIYRFNRGSPPKPTPGPKPGPKPGPTEQLKHIPLFRGSWWVVQTIYWIMIFGAMGATYTRVSEMSKEIWIRKGAALTLLVPAVFWGMYYARGSYDPWIMTLVAYAVTSLLLFYFWML
jgi:hypothetical protein